MPSLQEASGGAVSRVVESTEAATMTTTTTTATACAGPSTATGSSTTASITTIDTPAAATMGGLNPNLTIERDMISSSSSIMTNKRQLAERKQQLHTLENNHSKAPTDPSAGEDPTQNKTKPGAVSVVGPRINHHGSESSSESSSFLEETSLRPSLTGTGAATQSSLSSIHQILCAELVNEDEIRQQIRQETEAELRQNAPVAQATILVDVESTQVISDEQKVTGASMGTAAASKISCTAIASLVCSILGILSVLGGFILGPVAIILAVVALKKIKAKPDQLMGKCMAKAGLIMGIMGLILSITWFILIGVLAEDTCDPTYEYCG